MVGANRSKRRGRSTTCVARLSQQQMNGREAFAAKLVTLVLCHRKNSPHVTCDPFEHLS